MQEEGSSSPSANLTILTVERTGTVGERVKLQFSDGSSFFALETELRQEGLSALELVPGLEVAADRVRRLQAVAERRRIRDKALDLLARSAHSRLSLRLKLFKRGFGQEAVEEVLDSLSESSYLDDRLFAEQWLSSRLRRHPEGRAMLVAGLLRKGVAREIAEAVVNDMLAPEVELDCATRALERLKRSGEEDREVLMRKLKMRGFSFPLIRMLLGDGEE